MKLYDAPNVRNVAVVGHGGCGKTTLVSALLFDMGASTRLGRVEDGTTVTDFDADEIERKISLQAAVAWGEWKKTRINLIDAPGYANFVAEARAAPCAPPTRPSSSWTPWRASRSRPRRPGPSARSTGSRVSW